MRAFGRHQPEAEVARIVVLRANGLGDLVFALPALDALRGAYPAARITLLATEWHRDLLEARPGPVDGVGVLPPVPGVRAGTADAGAIERFCAALVAERFDLALQLHGGGRFSNAFVARFGARLTAGSRTPDAPPLDRWLSYVYLQPEVLRYLELVALVGAAPVGLEPRLAVTREDLAEAAPWADGPGPLAVLHPGATDGRRRWPAERFAAVGDALAAGGATVLVSGGLEERGLAGAVAGAMRAAVRDVSGRLSLGGLAGLLSRAGVVVSNDSGPLHLAAAVGAPTVGIYWTVNLLNAMLPWRARHRPLASFARHCPRCGADSLAAGCAHRDSHVTEVGTAEVTAAAEELLGLDVGDREAHARALDPRA